MESTNLSHDNTLIIFFITIFLTMMAGFHCAYEIKTHEEREREANSKTELSREVAERTKEKAISNELNQESPIQKEFPDQEVTPGIEQPSKKEEASKNTESERTQSPEQHSTQEVLSEEVPEKQLPAPDFSCPRPLSPCHSKCMDLRNNPLHCGTCKKRCATGQVCINSKCQCQPNQNICQNRCVNILTDNKNCGRCGKYCLKGQTCNNRRCNPPCGDFICGGACYKSSRSNCSTCGDRCKENEKCYQKQCVDDCFFCPLGYLNCNKRCIDPKNDKDEYHCRGCKPCLPGSYCHQSTCKVLYCPSCSNGAKGCLCDGACINSDTNIKHCGGCGRKCPSNQLCQKGKCVLKCTSKTHTPCFGKVCVDLQSNVEHCGGCGLPCPKGHICVKGKCACPTGKRKDGCKCL